MKALGTSADITSRPSLASTAAVRRMLSRCAVGLALSSLECHCSLEGFPLATMRPLIVPSRFSVRNMRASSALCFSSAVILDTSTGVKHFLPIN